MTDQNTDKRLFLLDAYALIFRGYYAFIKNPRINSKGLNTSAILGFLNSLLDVLKREKPTHLAVVFDVGSASTLRHEYFPEYKANRDETPEGIKVAVPYIQEILRAMQIPIKYAEGYEADDVIATLANLAAEKGFTTYMMTPDKDFAQLVNDQIKMYKPSSRGNGIEIWGREEVCSKFGIEDPLQVIDYLGMTGDAVDNIPGIPGVGPKTAQKLLSDFGSMEGLYENLDALKGKLRENVENYRDQAFLSKKLATILVDAPVEFCEIEYKVEHPDFDKIKEIFTELEFRRLLENLYRTYNVEEKIDADKPQITEGEQISMFGDSSTSEITTESSFENIETRPHFYQLVDSEMGRKILIQNLLKQKEICLDSETTGLNAQTAELVGLAFSYEADMGYYVNFPENFEETRLILEEFKPILENSSQLKIGQNLKYDIKVLNKYGIELSGPIFDTMVAHYVINPDMRHGLNVLSETYLKYEPVEIESLIGKPGKNQKTIRAVDIQIQTEYAVEDTDVTLRLKKVFEPMIENIQAGALLENVEFPLVNVLAQMENNGITVDVSVLNQMSQSLEKELQQLEENIFAEAGREFNINSPKQLGEILFEELEINKKAKKTRTGQYKTSEDVLIELRDKHPIVKEVLEYRQIQKLKSTYVDALPLEVNSLTGRIHTTFAQTVAATGRLASNNPNLQNIPIRTERGQMVRKAFVAKNEDYVLLAADYSQIELRLVAGMSGDETMKASFLKGEDIHAATAARVFDVPLAEVTREQRSHAKTVNFGIIYGVSAFGLSNQTDLSRSESKDLIDTYFRTYPRLKEFMDEQIAKARKLGYVETILGRRRYLPDIHSQNWVVKGQAERTAINAPVQGSAADVIKVAMVKLHEILKGYDTKMLLQVHDELIFEVPKSEVDVILPIIKTTMENALTFDIPLIVDCGVGKNWLEAH
ncbi:MAG: DNA polymerase I [Flavobacteriaceae bacterium]|nr:DNA polymerase I [Flavobacteriaceae bacterium]